MKSHDLLRKIHVKKRTRFVCTHSLTCGWNTAAVLVTLTMTNVDSEEPAKVSNNEEEMFNPDVDSEAVY